MAKSYYLPKSDEDRVLWLNNFSTKIVYYAIKYNITPEEVMDMQNSALYFEAVVKYKNQLNAHNTATTDHKNAMRDGLPDDATLQGLQPPMLMLPAPVQPGIFKRAKALVNRIKAHVNYAEADGKDLGIIGAELSIDFHNIKPNFSIRLVAGGHPDLV